VSTHVPVEAYRSRIESIGSGISIIMPSRRSLFLAAIVALWLAFWVLPWLGVMPIRSGGIHMSGTITPPPIFFVLWSTGGVFALAVLAWTTAGRERVTIDTDTFAIRREALGIGYTRRYAVATVRALRVVDDASSSTSFGSFGRGDPFGLRTGSFAFDYGAKTIRFGSGIDAAEAKYILSRVTAAKPALASPT
jgi:hypothetical protein